MHSDYYFYKIAIQYDAILTDKTGENSSTDNYFNVN